MSVTWNADAAAHLLRRAGFGGDRRAVLRAVRRGRAATVDALLADREPSARFRRPGDTHAIARWWLARMASGRAALHEKTTLFWHGHFATSVSKVEDPRLHALQNATLRRHALGRFRDLVVAVSRDPAMIFWLDNLTNEKGAPNENYAREVLELFTVGIRGRDGAPNYSETDVRELARCFTGWTTVDGAFFFDAVAHDDGPKRVLGVDVPARPAAAGEQDALEVIDHVVRTPACARFLAAKLWTFFAHPDPPDDVVDALADAYLAADTRIAPVLRALFLRDEFHSERARTERVASPVEFAVATLRAAGARTSFSGTPAQLRDMGQELFAPPNVAGWPGGLAWMTSVTRYHRMRFAYEVASGRVAGTRYRTDPRRLLSGLPRGAGADEVVARVLDAFGVRATPATRAALAGYLGRRGDATDVPFDARDDAAVDEKLRGLVGLVLTLPEAALA